MSTTDGSSENGISENILPAAAVLERISDCFLALDTDWRITYINEKAAENFQRRREDVTGRVFWKEFPEIADTEFGRACREAARTQVQAHVEARFARHNRWFHLHVYPSPDGLSVFFRDSTEGWEMRRQLEENEQRYRSLFEQNRDAVFSFDLEGRFTEANHACEVLTGYKPEELLGTSFLPLVAPEDQPRIVEFFQDVRAGKPHQEEFTLIHKTGRRAAISAVKVPIVVDGEVIGVYGIASDITASKQAEIALRESESWMRLIAETSPVALTITRWQDGAILHSNRYFRELIGLDSEEEACTHHTTEFFADPADREVLRQALTEHDHLQSWEGNFRKMDGTTFWATGAFQRMVYRGEPVIFAAYHDISERRRMLEEARDEADRDPLTGLLNHRAFHKRFRDEAARTQAEGCSLAVAVLDLDNFKFFNDAYGHAVGDDVLRQAADALRGACRSGDILARFGGDEFALLLPNVSTDTSAEEIARRLSANLRGISHAPTGYETAVPVSLSVGVALFPAESPTRLGVLQLADERLLRAKTGAAFDSETLPLRAALRSRVQGFAMLEALVTAVDAKDRYTRRHSEDVMRYSLQIAQALGLDEATRHTVAVSALLHDVGKIGVPDFVLRKPGRLTDEEFEAIKLHPNIGAVIVAAVPGLEKTLDAVQHHHERWDGQGYPFGLRGEETPLIARLMAVADAYSAMTTDRPYRKGMEPTRALGILEAGEGTQWDPSCVQAFVHSYAQTSPAAS